MQARRAALYVVVIVVLIWLSSVRISFSYDRLTDVRLVITAYKFFFSFLLLFLLSRV